MTLPGFDYPDQSAWGWAPGVWQEHTARQILDRSQSDGVESDNLLDVAIWQDDQLVVI